MEISKNFLGTNQARRFEILVARTKNVGALLINTFSLTKF